MDISWTNVLVAFLLINAVFWGLGHHDLHCQALSKVGVGCVDHKYHVVLGIICFVAAAYVQQRRYFSNHKNYV
jgi:hypothetical protein